jgi:methionine-rich copper-binding protein CopC
MRRSIVAALAWTFAFAAYAHTQLQATTPAADASVIAPRTIEFTFAGDVRLTSVSLEDSTGAAKHLDAVPTEIASQFALGVHESLTPGDYKVTWRAVGGDTHIVSGEFVFKVVADPR